MSKFNLQQIFLLSIFFYLCLFPLRSVAQLDSTALSKEPEFISMDDALKNPAKVYKLNLRKQKLKKFPKEIFTFTNLQELNLSRNKIDQVPEEIGQLTKLQILDLSRNKLKAIPSQIGKLVRLRKLLLYLNEIPMLPAEIGNLTLLQTLDMWGNEISEFPPEISKLKSNLRYLDLRVIDIPQPLQDKIVLQLPMTTIYFSKSCNCR
jgi:Leucine-rich repeat (LRR) protein